MNHNEKAKGGAQSEEDEPLFFMVGLGVLEQQGLLVKEDRLRLFKRDAVLLLVGPCLTWIPHKPDLTHVLMYISSVYKRNRS